MPPTIDEIRLVSRQVVDIFQSAGIQSCLCGGTGCALYGCSRTPNDVDVLVLTNTYDTEQLKEFVARTMSGDFFLRNSQKIGATHKILYRRLGTGYGARECKVDILVPGILNIPNIPEDRLVNIQNLPIMPSIPLLLLKLQTWANHRDSDMWEKRAKEPNDIWDVDELLGIVINKNETMQGASSWLPASFVEAGRKHATRYVQQSATARHVRDWQTIGMFAW